MPSILSLTITALLGYASGVPVVVDDAWPATRRCDSDEAIVSSTDSMRSSMYCESSSCCFLIANSGTKRSSNASTDANRSSTRRPYLHSCQRDFCRVLELQHTRGRGSPGWIFQAAWDMRIQSPWKRTDGTTGVSHCTLSFVFDTNSTPWPFAGACIAVPCPRLGTRPERSSLQWDVVKHQTGMGRRGDASSEDGGLFRRVALAR